MLTGDANGDNVVNATDFTILKATFGRSTGQLGFDDRADFNGDQVVNSVDFTLEKRNFGHTPEPRGREHANKKRTLSFVIQKHAARRLHYDFRLELEGVLNELGERSGEARLDGVLDAIGLRVAVELAKRRPRPVAQ